MSFFRFLCSIFYSSSYIPHIVFLIFHASSIHSHSPTVLYSSHSLTALILPLLSFSYSCHSPTALILPHLSFSHYSHSTTPLILPLLSFSHCSHSPTARILPSYSSHSPTARILSLLSFSHSFHSPTPLILPLLSFPHCSHSPILLLLFSYSSHSLLGLSSPRRESTMPWLCGQVLPSSHSRIQHSLTAFLVAFTHRTTLI
jgi:hypothetical protein